MSHQQAMQSCRNEVCQSPFTYQRGAISSLAFAALLIAGLPACATDVGAPSEDSGAQEGATDSALERAGEVPGQQGLAAYYCGPGYHGHYVDWDATRIVPYGACDSSNGLVGYGHPICMLDGTQGYSCGGAWMVPAYSPANGLYGAIKINALNGH